MKGQKQVFRSEAAFTRATAAYLDYCAGVERLSAAASESRPGSFAKADAGSVPDGGGGSSKAKAAAKRLPNVAGFCRFARITRAEFASLKIAYPRAFDIMESAFTDEAVNNKLLNTGSVLGYLLNSVNRFDGGEEDGGLEFEHDLEEDGG